MEKSVTATFLPYGKKIRVSPGSKLLDAANLCGIYLNTVCGGQGSCGKCLVIVRSGEVRGSAPPDSEGGAPILACRTKVVGDTVIEIPRSSLVGEDHEEKILLDSLTFGSPEECPCPEGANGKAEAGPALTRKVHLDLDPPSLDDPTADYERFLRSLRQQTAADNVRMGLEEIRSLATVLREGSWQVTATLTQSDTILEVLRVEPGNTRDRNYGLAVDIGTTTVVVELVHLGTRASLGTQASYNLQIGYGEDVISRIAFACSRGGQKTLQDSVVETINRLIRALSTANRIDPQEITAAVCAGNTTMTHLLLGLPPRNIRLEPYVPVVNQYPTVRAQELGLAIHPHAVVFCMPGVSSYVGGDITAGVLYTDIADSEDLSLLMDLGTNGEMVLGNREWLTCCSASMGPAFEGGGIRWGMRAASGAIERVSLNGTGGDLRYETIGGRRPRGICGSGLIDLLGTFLLKGVIDQQGRFNPAAAGRRWREHDGSSEYVVAFRGETEAGEDIAVSQEDILNVIRSKGAVYAAAQTMAQATGIGIEQIRHILVAGGFGTCLDIEKAILIGLLPDLPPERFRFVGNSSLKGARRALLCRYYLDKARTLSGSMTNLELSVYPGYMDEYVAALFLPHTDLASFPTVRERLRQG
jgi:uncharacterized 2Fe-2S/4Fe-4S cluster protein (DUF4445 family)